MKILFLDFDGVLNNDVFWHRVKPTNPMTIDASSIPLLNEIVDRTGASVVVHSTWKRHLTTDDLRDFLQRHGFTGRVIDTTPTKFSSTKPAEIGLWLDDHPEVDNFVILDDEGPHLFGEELSTRLVQTNPIHGLRAKDVEKCTEILSGESWDDQLLGALQKVRGKRRQS